MTKITEQFAPQHVTDTLKTLNKDQVDWYLTRGEPQCLQGQFLVDGDFAIKLFPGLRGIIVGKEVKTAKQAIAAAQKVRDNALARSPQAFDETMAGLSTEANDLQVRFEENLLRVEDIAHVGTMQDGSIADPLERILDNLICDGKVGEYAKDLVFLNEDLAGAEVEDIVSMMRDRGAVGFLIEVSVPEQTPRSDKSRDIHYHTRHTQIIYGSTYQVACEKALAWAEQRNASFSKKVAA